MSDEESPTLWQRARRRAHEEIAAVAMTLFLENGFAETTVDQIAAAAGIGRRSFFRYFGSKEDVVIGVLVADAALLRTELERQPEDRDAWAALTGAVLALDDGAAERERALAVARMVYDTPSLRARSIEKHLRWYDELAPEVERRLGGRTDATLRARAIVATFATCLDIAGEAWVRDGGTGTLRTYLDAALSAVRT
ncbi:TetR/AcrR family transcriptional regulator [Georgenia phoenicis]|uniref:TetR/AcrR family transcriptional regulator n=1 Tax=unclassified Georgenia TaxID=2626815 RepID=UPI0039AF74E6